MKEPGIWILPKRGWLCPYCPAWIGFSIKDVKTVDGLKKEIRDHLKKHKASKPKRKRTKGHGCFIEVQMMRDVVESKAVNKEIKSHEEKV